MKSIILSLILAGLASAQTYVSDAGRTSWGDSLRWGDSDDSTTLLMARGNAVYRDSAGSWTAITTDSCSLPVRFGFSTLPDKKLELSYQVRTSSGNTDSSQIKLRIDTRYCKGSGTTFCDDWVAAGRYKGDTSTTLIDSLVTVATASGTTWKPTRQLFDVPGGSQIRFCADNYKAGGGTNDTTFFRYFVVRTSAIAAGGTVGGGGGGDASASNQTSGAQKTQIVDGSGNVIASTSNNLNVQCANCSGSGASAADEATFTAGSSVFAPGGVFYQTTATSNPLTNGQQGMIQGTAQRAAFANLRNSSGTEVGTSGAPLRTDPTGSTAQPVTDNGGSLTVDGTVAATQSGTWNVTNISGTVSLPTGAATAAKQPALGTAGSASTDVLTVQGIASMTPFLANPGTAANWGTGATGSAVPANAQYAGANSSGNLVGIIQADASAKIDVSTATTTELVALSAGKKIYVTSWDVIAAGTGTIKLVYGTGTACGTGTTDLTGAYSLVAQSGIAKGGGLGPILVVPASNALCVTTSAAVGMQGSMAYTQF